LSPLDLRRLAEALLDLHAEDPGRRPSLLVHRRAEPAGDVIGEQFRGGVGDRHERAFVAREAPVAVAIADPDVWPVLVEVDVSAPGGEHHPVVQLVDDRLRQVLEGNEVDDVVILVKVPLDLDGRPVIVAVNPLALIALIRDEMTRAEDEVVLRDADLESRRVHGRRILIFRRSVRSLA
jgi:hypothetical protein